MRKSLYGLAAVLTLASTGAGAFDLQSMSAEDRSAFRSEVRSYILENPEIIAEAQGALREKQAIAAQERDAQLVADNMEELFGGEMSPVYGNPDGSFTLVKFSDFSCPHCREAEVEIARFIEDHPDVKVIIKELPILGEGSAMAAAFAVAVRQKAGDAVYEEVKTKLFNPDGPRDNDFYAALVAELGLDAEEITDLMNSEEVRGHIRDNFFLAEALEIRGTPALIFNDLIVRGGISADIMADIYDQLSSE